MQPGEHIEDYEIVRLLTKESFVERHLVRHDSTGMLHLLVRLTDTAEADLRDRFLADARTQAQLVHAHVAAVVEIIDTPDHAAVVVESLPGGTLAERLHQMPANLSAFEVVELLAPLFDAMTQAHQRGIVHGAIHPGHIRFRDDSWHTATLTDFGGADRGPGMPYDPHVAAFLAPEQVRGDALTPRVDQFALAALAFELLVGLPPFVGRSTGQVIQHIEGDVRPALKAVVPYLPAAFLETIDVALRHDSNQRWLDLGAFHAAMTEAMEAAGREADARAGKDIDAATLLSLAGTQDEELAFEVVDVDDLDEVEALEVVEAEPAPLSSRPPPVSPSPAPRARASLPSMPKMPAMPKMPSVNIDPRMARVGAMISVSAATGIALAGGVAWAWSPSPFRDLPHPASHLVEGHDFAGPGGEVVRDHRYELAAITPGDDARVGSPPFEHGHADDEPITDVRVAPFLMGRTEVTQALYRAVMNDNPVASRVEDWGGASLSGTRCAEHGQGDEMPVFCVTWEDALRFANALSEAEGLEPAYQFQQRTVRWNPEADGYRLPTEAEWEVAARAGDIHAHGAATDALCEAGNLATWSTALVHGELVQGDTARCHDSHRALASVARYAPNAWKLHDTVGNVREWVWDAYQPDGVALDPSDERRRTSRTVVRGGAWTDGPAGQRLAARGSGDPKERSVVVGFRLARSLR